MVAHHSGSAQAQIHRPTQRRRAREKERDRARQGPGGGARPEGWLLQSTVQIPAEMWEDMLYGSILNVTLQEKTILRSMGGQRRLTIAHNKNRCTNCLCRVPVVLSKWCTRGNSRASLLQQGGWSTVVHRQSKAEGETRNVGWSTAGECLGLRTAEGGNKSKLGL